MEGLKKWNFTLLGLDPPEIERIKYFFLKLDHSWALFTLWKVYFHHWKSQKTPFWQANFCLHRCQILPQHAQCNDGQNMCNCRLQHAKCLPLHGFEEPQGGTSQIHEKNLIPKLIFRPFGHWKWKMTIVDFF